MYMILFIRKDWNDNLAEDTYCFLSENCISPLSMSIYGIFVNKWMCRSKNSILSKQNMI